MAKKPTNTMNDAKYGVQLTLDFNSKVGEQERVYDVEKHLQQFPRERRLIQQ